MWTISSLVNYLLELADGTVGDVTAGYPKELKKRVKRITINRFPFNGPILYYDDGGSISDPALKSIARKFMKHYSSQGNLDLLAYYDIQPVLPIQLWLPDVDKFVRDKISNRQFNRVWIYSVQEYNVIYAFPPLNKIENPQGT